MDTVDAFLWQARACADLGSPMYGALLTRVADGLSDGGTTDREVIADVLRGHEEDSGPSALALRLAGAVHRQVLQGDADDLARHYPSVGGEWDLEAAWAPFVATLRQRSSEIRRLLDLAPQTNEVGRSAALMGGLLHVAAMHGEPIRLFEIGSSGGLNLRADHYRYLRADGTGWGRPDSPVVLDPAWQGAELPTTEPQVVERSGSDLDPVDVTSSEGRLTLLSYVWPDQLARLARLRGAFEAAAHVPVETRRLDAVAALRGMRLRAGATTVLWHSVMWQYLGRDDQQAVTERIAELAADARENRPFVHLRLEPERRTEQTEREFLVVLEDWPSGEWRILGTAAPHGVPVTWE